MLDQSVQLHADFGCEFSEDPFAKRNYRLSASLESISGGTSLVSEVVKSPVLGKDPV